MGRLSLRAPTLGKFGGILATGAVILYPTVHLAEPAMVWVFERIEDPRYGSLVASLILFVAPTVVLGAISPYSVRLLVRQREESGKVAGTLYFVSTLGSALGTLATSFYFVLWFEIDTIVTGLAGTVACARRRGHRGGPQRGGPLVIRRRDTWRLPPPCCRPFRRHRPSTSSTASVRSTRPS